MKRNFELARLILQKMEDCDNPWPLIGPLQFDGYNNDQISYHILILEDAGLLEPHHESIGDSNGTRLIPGRLTWQGHDFLSLTQDSTIWTKAKETIIKPGVSFTFDLLWEWLKVQAKDKIGFP